jgi:transposase
MTVGRIDYKERERRRLKAAELFRRGIGPAEVSRRLQVHPQTAKEWKKAFTEEGLEGLRCKGPPGRKPKLGPEELTLLERILLAGALAYGFENDLWTCPRVAAVIRQEFGVWHHPDHVWRILTRMGFSCQVPEKRAREQDRRALEEWKQHQWPEIKKKPCNRGELSSSLTRLA